MNKIISKTVEFEADELPPSVDFIENKIREFNIEPLRWAIVDVKGNKLTVSVSGEAL